MLQEPFVDIPENVIRDALKVLLGMYFHHQILSVNLVPYPHVERQGAVVYSNESLSLRFSSHVGFWVFAFLSR